MPEVQDVKLKSLYSWAESIAAASSSTPKKNLRKRPPLAGGNEPSPKRLHTSQTVEPLSKQVQGNISDDDAGILDQEEAWSFPSDTYAALKMLWAQFPSIEKVSVPPFGLCSQLYSIVKDRTLVDRELEVLKQQMVIRMFKFSSGQDDYGIISLDHCSQEASSHKEHRK